MKNGTKILLLSILFLTFANAPAFAQEKISWVQKIKNFFTSSQPAVTQTVEQKEQPVPAEPAAWKPVFDFSEKTIGNRNAPIKINIFTSLTCPHCTVVHTQLLPYLEEKYVSKNEALIILTDFPIDTRAMTASLISRCLTDDKYHAFMESLFENQRHWVVAQNLQEALLPYAKLAGLTEEQMTACAIDESALKELVRQRNLTIMQFKVHATPTVILQLGPEKEKIEGAPSRPDIDRAIEKLKKTYTGPWPSAEKETQKPTPLAP